MNITTLAFIILSVIAVGSAIMMITSKSPVKSVLWLIVVFFTISGHYILLNAQFLAIVNIIVYACAIMVLFLFVLMLLNLNKEDEPNKKGLVKILAVIAGGCLVVTLVGSLKAVSISNPLLLQNPNLGLVKNLGKELFGPFMLPFELCSILLLTAMVGAVLLTKKEEKSNG